MLTLCVGSNPGPETSPVCLFDLSCSQRVQNFLTVSKPQLRPKQNWSLFSETVWISRDLNNESRQKKKIEFFFSAKTKSRLFFFIKQYVCYLFLLHSGMKTNTVTDITSKTHTHTHVHTRHHSHTISSNTCFFTCGGKSRQQNQNSQNKPRLFFFYQIKERHPLEQNFSIILHSSYCLCVIRLNHS